MPTNDVFSEILKKTFKVVESVSTDDYVQKSLKDLMKSIENTNSCGKRKSANEEFLEALRYAQMKKSLNNKSNVSLGNPRQQYESEEVVVKKIRPRARTSHDEMTKLYKKRKLTNMCWLAFLFPIILCWVIYLQQSLSQ